MINSSIDKILCGVAGVGYLGKHHARIYEELDICEFVGFSSYSKQLFEIKVQWKEG